MSPTDERSNLHRTIWRVANDLRGSVDGWDFKAYVLGMLFYRFISEHIVAFVKQVQAEAGSPDFDYSLLPDDEAEVQSKYQVNTLGFFIRPSDLFSNVREHAPHDQNLNETLGRVFQNIEASAVGTSSEDDMKGLFADIDTNSAKLGNTIAQRNEKLTKLLDAIGDLELGGYRDTNIDTFGDAYEYLMTMYASSAGKSGGEFFTPQCVAELIARITVLGKNRVNRVYDMAILELTALPFVIHDSTVIKQIAYLPVVKMLELNEKTAKLYDRCGDPKQVFFAFDVSPAYGQEAVELSDELRAIHLDDGTKALYGYTWNTKKNKKNSEKTQ